MGPADRMRVYDGLGADGAEAAEPHSGKAGCAVRAVAGLIAPGDPAVAGTRYTARPARTLPFGTLPYTCRTCAACRAAQEAGH